MEYISEKEAWELCGEYFSLPLKRRYEISGFASHNEGICDLLRDLVRLFVLTESSISQKVYSSMITKIDKMIVDERYKTKRRGSCWLCKPNTNGRGDFLRATFCYLMSEACEDM